jgi:hypothetical protein
MAKASKHLSAEDGQEKKKQDGDFEIVRSCRPNLGEIIKTPRKQNGAANHSRDFEIGQALVIEHSVEFPKSDQSEQADQQPKQDLVPGEHDQQSDCPKRDRADEPQNESGAGHKDVGPGLLQCGRHALHHLEGTNLVQARISNRRKMERVVLNALANEMRLTRLSLNLLEN